MSKTEKNLAGAFAASPRPTGNISPSLRRLIKRVIHRLPSFLGLRGRLKPFTPTLICAPWEKLEKLRIISRWQ